ncbi:MAG: hypothetical protein GY906_22920 [bacterium]|nr:hypothetical protein [bacterium]
MGKNQSKPSPIESGKVVIFQLAVPMPPGMTDEEANGWLEADITLAVGLVAHGPQVTIGTGPAMAPAPGGPRLQQ